MEEIHILIVDTTQYLFSDAEAAYKAFLYAKENSKYPEDVDLFKTKVFTDFDDFKQEFDN